MTASPAVTDPLVRVGVARVLRRLVRWPGRRREPVVCDLAGWPRADLGAIDLLSRLQLVLKRDGGQIRLVNAPGRLAGLIELVGLDEVLVVQSRRESE